MRLRRLWLENFYNLQDFELVFDPRPSIYGSTSIRFFAGLNGSGKSNALEAIGLIFGHLAIRRPVGIVFEIEYELNGQEILVTNRPGGPFASHILDALNAAVLVKDTAKGAWRSDHARSALSGSMAELVPGRIAGYSTGPTTGLQWALAKSLERQLSTELGDVANLVKPADMADRTWRSHLAATQQDLIEELEAYRDNIRSYFIDAADAMFAAAALLAHEGLRGQELTEFRRRRRLITDRVDLDPEAPLRCFALHVAGDWASRLTPARQRRLRSLLGAATVRRAMDAVSPPHATANGDAGPRDFYAVFDVDQAFAADRLPKIMPTPLVMFEELLACRRQGAIKEVRLVLKKRRVRGLLPESALSDGEHLLLGRYALLLLLQEVPEVLVLLDEPESHFNDRWRVELVADLRRLLRSTPGLSRSTHTAEILVATHSDLTLTDADPAQVYLFQAGVPGPPPISTFAANRADIARALFGTPHGIGSYSNTRVVRAVSARNPDSAEALLPEMGPGFARILVRDRVLKSKPAMGRSKNRKRGTSAATRH